MTNQINTHFPIKKALLSVSNKTGIVEFASALANRGVQILSTGGTAKLLREAGIMLQEVSEYTDFPEIMNGRLKTLHPKIHGGLLGRRGVDQEVMIQNHIEPIDLLVVNLYPFAETVANPQCDLATAVEQIDIGGPAMLRSAAKNYAYVTTVVKKEDYSIILQEMELHSGCISLATRFKLAQKVFSHTAQYEAAIANYLNRINLEQSISDFPETFTLQFTKKQDLRYGENPHQKAALYVENLTEEIGIATAIQHQGKPLSFNNIADTNAALECAKNFNRIHACVIVKHANPCGVALSHNDQLQAYQRALATDPLSAFGGIIAFNKLLTATTAKYIVQNQFVEVVIAPEIEQAALCELAHKPNIRVLSCGEWQTPKPSLDFTRISGGLLIQERDITTLSPHDLKIVSQREPSVQEFNDLLFAWEVVKCVKSNAIVYAKNRATIGIGAGQMSRVFSAMIAGMKANESGLEVAGSVMASDAFFPFRDTVDLAANAGITAIIQPGGSMRDSEVIHAANEAGIAMVFTGMRHFKH